MSDKKRRPWTKEEDEILRKRIKSYGLNNWGMVADGLPGRSGKSCSERWRIYLTPGVKRPTQEPFNEYEVAVIYLGQLVHGNQWSAIAKLLPGRTNTAIKNLWKTALQSPEAKRVVSNQYIQAGHTLDSLLANPPTASEMAAAQRHKAAAAAARKRKADAAAAAAAAAADSSGSDEEGGSSADEGEEGSASAGREEDRAAAAAAAAAGCQDSDPMQVDHPGAAAARAGRVPGRQRDQQAGSPGSAGSESNMHETGVDAAAAAAAAAAAGGGGVSSADKRCSADGSSRDPHEALHPGSCSLLNPVYGALGDVDFGFDSPDSGSPLGSSCDQLGGSGWEMSEPADMLLPEGEQEAAAAAAAASLGAPAAAAAAPRADSCGEANSNSNNSSSPAEAAAAPATAQVQAAQVPQTVPTATTPAAAAAAAPTVVPGAAAPAAPRMGGLKPGTGLRVLLPPGSIEAVQLPKPQQQQQPATQAQQQAAQAPAASSQAVTPAGAAAMVPVVAPQQLTPQQQQQLQAQLMLQAWQQSQAMQLQQAAARHAGKSCGSNSSSSGRRVARRRPARGAAKSRPESESDNDAEIDEAATRAAAEAIASGAIKLNPNVHPAAAAAAAADAARAAARAAARKAASAAAASARKKNKAVSAPASEPTERKLARTAAAADSDADEEEDEEQQQQEEQQELAGSGAGRQGRHRRRAAAGVAKVVAAEADEATHLGLLNPADTSAQDPAAAAATAMHVDYPQHSMGMSGGAAPTGAQSEYTMSYTPVYTSSSSGMPCAPQAAAAAPAHSAPAAGAGPGDMLQHFSDDPIMMELFKHEMSVAHALQHAPTSSAPAAATTPTAAVAAAAAASAPLSPSLQQQQQCRVGAGSGGLSCSPVLVPLAAGGGAVVAATTSSSAGPACGLAAAPLLTVGSSAGALPSPGPVGAVGAMDPAEAAATPRGQAGTAGPSEASAATAGVLPAAPVQQLQRQVSLAVPGTPAAGAACSTADSEGSVFTASSRNSCTITSSRTSPAGVAVAALPSGFVPQGQHHHAGSVGYYVTFTAPNGTRQQVLVQPAPAAGVPGAAVHSSSGGSFSGVPMQQQQMVAGQCTNVMTDVAGTCSLSMPMSAPVVGIGGMLPIVASSAPCVSMPLGSNSAMYGQCMAAAGGQQHSNPVLAAMLSNSSDMSAHNPVLHATMAALSNQGSCTCVYCLTSAGRQQGMCRPAQQQQGCVMAHGSSGGGGQQAGPTPAQLASWAMPPPRPVLLPQHPLAGKQAAAAAAAITAAAAGAGVRPPASLASAGTNSSGAAGQQGTPLSGGMGLVTAGMAPQLPVSQGAAAAVEKVAEAAAAAAVAAAAVGGLMGSDDDEHDWGFDVVDLDSLDVTF